MVQACAQMLLSGLLPAMRNTNTSTDIGNPEDAMGYTRADAAEGGSTPALPVAGWTHGPALSEDMRDDSDEMGWTWLREGGGGEDHRSRSVTS